MTRDRATYNVPESQPRGGAAPGGHAARRLAEVVVAALALTLMACRGGAVPTPTQSPVAGPTASPAATVPAPQTSPTPAPAPMTLYVWVSPEFSPLAQADASTSQGFSQMHPGVRVQISVKETYGQGGLVDLLSKARTVAPAYLPDLILTTDGALEQIASLGVLQPMEALLPSAHDGLFANLKEAGSAAFVRLGAPFAMDFLLVAYHMPMTLPLSWDGIAAAGRRCAFAAGDEEIAAEALLTQYLALGGSLVGVEGAPSLDGRLLTRALENYRGLVDQAVLVPETASLTSSAEVWELYRAGEADLVMVPASHVGRGVSVPGGMGLAAVPTTGGDSIPLAHVWAWAIVAPTPERQQAATRFLEWVLRPEQQAAWCDAAGLLPTKPSAWGEAHGAAARSEAVLGAAQAAVPYPVSLRTSGVRTALQLALVQVLRGQWSPKQAADQALNKIKQP